MISMKKSQILELIQALGWLSRCITIASIERRLYSQSGLNTVIEAGRATSEVGMESMDC